MSILSRFHLPYREDKLFSLLFFIVLLIPLVFTLYDYENFESIKFGLFLLLTGFALVVLAGKKFLGPKAAGWLKSISVPEKVFLALLAAFWVWALLSALHAPDKLYAFVGFYYRFVNGFIFYTALAVFALLLFFALNKERFLFLARSLVFASLFIAVVGIIQSMGIAFYGGLEPMGFLRAPSLLGNPNFSAMFIVAVLPLSFGFFASSISLKSRLYYGVVIFLSLWSLVLFSSRGAWVALAGSIIFLGFLILRYKFKLKYFFAVSAALLLFAGLGSAFLQVTRPSSIVDTLNFTDTNIGSRLFAWDIARQAIVQHPWLGVGLSNFQNFFVEARGKNLADGGLIFDDPHNLFLSLAATGGVPFVLFFLGFIAAALYGGLERMRKEPDFFLICLEASVVAWLAAAFFTPVSIGCFILLPVLLAGLLKFTDGSADPSVNFGLKLAGGFVGAILLLAGAGFLIGENLSYAGREAYQNQNFKRGLILQNLAIKFNPTNQLYYINKASDQTMIGGSQEAVLNTISQVSSLHPLEANGYASASNLYYILYLEKKQPEFLQSAIDELRQAIKLDPFLANRYGKLGFYLYMKGDLSAALDSISYGLSLDQKQFSSWMLMAKIYQLQGRRAPALYVLEKAYRQQPTLPEMRYIWYSAKYTPDIKKVPINFFVQNRVQE